MNLSLEQTDKEILADLKGSRTLEVILRVIEQARSNAALQLDRACREGSSDIDGLARTWSSYGHVLNLIKGEVEAAKGEE